MIDNRNMILAVVLSIAILLGFELFFEKTRPPAPPGDLPATTEGAGHQADGHVPSRPASEQITAAGGAQIPSAPSRLSTAAGDEDRQTILARTKRVLIDTPRLHGSISLVGGRIDDLTLADYRETLDPNSTEIVLLSPQGANNAYYAQFGWVPSNDAVTPQPDTEWAASGDVLSPSSPVTLNWDNGDGLVFHRTYAIDENYMVSITQRLSNNGPKPVSVHSYGLISRRGTPETTDFYILHEGLLGVFGGTLSEIDYDDVKESGLIEQRSTGGWLGITDKYWLAALIPDQTTTTTSRFLHRMASGVDKYQVDYRGPKLVAPAGGAVETRNQLFTGAKEVLLMDGYEKAYGIDRFELAIDWGWFYFLTKPIFYSLLWINDHVPNLGVSILLLTVVIKLAFFPLANKSYTSMSKMKKLQPEMTKMRDRFGDDKVKLNQEMMALYKREKVNPASGCLPIVVQIPVFFALYKVLFVTIEMRHAPFFGWIQDLSAPDPTTVFNLFGVIPWTPPEFLMIGVWPLIMGITMFLQQKLNPQPTDPVQAKIFLFLPIMFTFLLARFPAGLVIYWAWNNLLSMLQQWVIMRRMGITGKEALR
ncbi:MAG: membrane protein insertase YidC [Pseudomonadota bacterium]|nr:membrane protein insertase YidC [Pseudomonadota bacterium]